MKGWSRIDSTALGRHAFCNNLEERRELAAFLFRKKEVFPFLPRAITFPSAKKPKAMAYGLLTGSGPLQFWTYWRRSTSLYMEHTYRSVCLTNPVTARRMMGIQIGAFNEATKSREGKEKKFDLPQDIALCRLPPRNSHESINNRWPVCSKDLLPDPHDLNEAVSP